MHNKVPGGVTLRCVIKNYWRSHFTSDWGSVLFINGRQDILSHWQSQLDFKLSRTIRSSLRIQSHLSKNIRWQLHLKLQSRFSCYNQKQIQYIVWIKRSVLDIGLESWTKCDGRISRASVSPFWDIGGFGPRAFKPSSSQPDDFKNWYSSLPSQVLGIIRIGQAVVGLLWG